MRLERLNLDNLREGIFCAKGNPHESEMHEQLEAWLEGARLRGQLARGEGGELQGFILYYPIKEAPLDVEGDGLYMVQCLYVKPEAQSKGVGKALINSVLSDARESGRSGIAVEGFEGVRRRDFDYMPSAFFRHLGMQPGESRRSGTLYYSLESNAKPPKYLEPKIEVLRVQPRIKVDVFDCRRCFVGISNREVIKTVVESVYPSNVELAIHDQTTRQAVVDKGMSSGVFIDGKLTFFSGPINEEDVMTALDVAMAAREQQIDR